MQSEWSCSLGMPHLAHPLSLLLLLLPHATALTPIETAILRSERSRIFDTLTEVVDSEYKDKPIQADQFPTAHFQSREVYIEKENAHLRDVLFEGDIMASTDLLNRVLDYSLHRQEHRHRRQAFVDKDYPSTIWSRGVPYILSDTLTESAKKSILRAIEFWQKETCIDFWERTTEPQYLYFIGDDSGCWSAVGKELKLGPQKISLGRGCSHFGVTSHELAHALGLFHEQSRYDRDSHITLHANRVSRRLLYNFAKVGTDELDTYTLPYDVGSVMHYAPTEFATDRSQPVLTAVDPNLQFAMGSLSGPSFIDVALINEHYTCSLKCFHQLPCLNGGYTDPRNCSQCKCPSGFGGVLCDDVDASFTTACGGTVEVGEDVRRFSIVIRQRGDEQEKRCIYHFKAPSDRRILFNVIALDANCVEGCHLDSAEFKMVSDMRPVGYRVCCDEQKGLQYVSMGDVVPAIFLSNRNTFRIQFEFTLCMIVNICLSHFIIPTLCTPRGRSPLLVQGFAQMSEPKKKRVLRSKRPKSPEGAYKKCPSQRETLDRNRDFIPPRSKRGHDEVHFSMPPARIYPVNTDPASVPVVPTSKMKSRLWAEVRKEKLKKNGKDSARTGRSQLMPEPA